ncbi:MAG: twin-arginine translocase TatA/TatE family subunit [Dissulfurispiraceae bacterium]
MFRGLFQPMHLIVILGILLVIFGPSKLPELGAGIGRGIKEFKKSLSHDEKAPSEEDNKTQSSDVTRE